MYLSWSIWLIAAAALGASDAGLEPPPGLACLAAWYPVQARLGAGSRWEAVLADGQVVPWDDGRAKTYEEKLAEPDLEDALSIPYRRGPVRPVTAENDDPGRIRVDALFRATFGHGQAEVRRNLVEVELLGQRLQVHRRARAAFERAGARLAELVRKEPGLRSYLAPLGGTFAWRTIAGTGRPSAHSYGISLDLNVQRASYWEWQRPRAPLRWQNQIPQAIVDALEAEGFIWGGRWYHYDTMHFELRPELLDPRCGAR